MFSITLQLGRLFRAALHSEVQFKLFPGSLETWLLVGEAPHGQQRQAICSGWNHPPSKAIPSSDPARTMGQCWEHQHPPLESQAWGMQGVCPDPEHGVWGGCWFLGAHWMPPCRLLVLGAFGKLSLRKEECTHSGGAWRRAGMTLCLAVVPVNSPEDKGEVVLQLKGSTAAECP